MKIVDKMTTSFGGVRQFKNNDRQDKKLYISPDLKLLGNLSAVTLGGTIGTLDTGDSGTKRPEGSS